MVKGSCLCGQVRFEVEKVIGPAEICHCNRCRKQSGSNAMVMGMVRTEGFRVTSGAELIKSYSAPILHHAPAYKVYFCTQCGNSVPNPNSKESKFEIPMGLFDDNPCIKPDKHIYIECIPEWDEIGDKLPQFDLASLRELRVQSKDLDT